MLGVVTFSITLAVSVCFRDRLVTRGLERLERQNADLHDRLLVMYDSTKFFQLKEKESVPISKPTPSDTVGVGNMGGMPPDEVLQNLLEQMKS